MTQFRFHYGPTLTSGPGASRSIAPFLGASPVLFATDKAIMALGLADETLRCLRAGGRHVEIFDTIEADPSLATLEAAVEAGRRAEVGSVVGFGGGSPMDVAKLAAYLLGSDDPLDRIWGVDQTTGQGLPLILVPTTAGTGSEATPVSIITLPDGEKRGVSAASLIADHAVLDPLLTVRLPRSITAATGMDAMVHAIEAFTSARLKNPLSDMLAQQALRLLATNFPVVCASPENLAAREAMMLGAHLAGVAFANAPVGGVHALAYPLGSRFHIPHGLSNVLMLPHVLGFNMGSANALYAELGPIVDHSLAGRPSEMRAEGLRSTLQAMAASADMPSRLSEVGIVEADLDQLATDAMKQERLLKNNPRPLAWHDARGLYEAAL